MSNSAVMAGTPAGGPDDLEGIAPDVFARRWKILGVLCASLMIVIVGNTVLNVALLTLQKLPAEGGIGATQTQVQWIVDAYGLVFAGLLFTAGAIGDRFGRKGALQGGLVVFAIGSLIGAFGDSASTLIIARAVMGIGGAFVMPSTLSILTNVFPSRERAKAIAVWAGISGGGAAIGPLASGFLLEHFWWGSVFLINIPIIAVALIAGYILVPKSRDAEETPLDPVGAVLSIIGLSALVYAIIEGPHHGWVSGTSAMWFGIAVVALVAFVGWEHRVEHPMLDMELFRIRRFAVASGGITLIFFAMFGVFFMAAPYLQGVLGYSPFEAAVRMLPMSFVMMAVAPQTPRLVGRFGANVVAAFGLVLVGVAFVLTTRFRVDTSYVFLLLTFCVLAVGMALTMTPMTTQLMASVPRNRAGMGSATNDTTRELGGALGVAVLGSLLAARYKHSLEPAVAGVSDPVIRGEVLGSVGGALSAYSRGEVDEGVVGAAMKSFTDGFTFAATVAAVIVFACALLVWKFLPADRHAAEVSGEAFGEHIQPESLAEVDHHGHDTHVHHQPAQHTD